MKKPSLLFTLALAGYLAAAGPSLPLALAQTTTTTHNYAISGGFRSSDGTAGTYVETRFNNGTSTTDTIVYTSTDATTTGTDTTVTTLNADDSKTVVFTHVALGTTAPFTSTTTFAALTTTATYAGGTTTRTSPSPYGTGTFTAEDGTTGTLTTFVADGIASTDYVNATLGLTRVFREEGSDGRRNSIKILSVSPAGVLTTTTLTLNRGGGRGHR